MPPTFNTYDMGIVLETIDVLSTKIRTQPSEVTPEEREIFEIALDISFMRAISNNNSAFSVMDESRNITNAGGLGVESTTTPNLHRKEHAAKFGYLFRDTKHFINYECAHERLDIVTSMVSNLILGKKLEEAAIYSKLFAESIRLGEDRLHNKAPFNDTHTEPLDEEQIGNLYATAIGKFTSKYNASSFGSFFKTPSKLFSHHNTACLGITTAILKGGKAIVQETWTNDQGPKVTLSEEAIRSIKSDPRGMKQQTIPETHLGFGHSVGNLSQEETANMADKVLKNIEIIFNAKDPIFLKLFTPLIAYLTKNGDQSLLLSTIVKVAPPQVALSIGKDKIEQMQALSQVDTISEKSLKYAAERCAISSDTEVAMLGKEACTSMGITSESTNNNDAHITCKHQQTWVILGCLDSISSKDPNWPKFLTQKNSEGKLPFDLLERQTILDLVRQVKEYPQEYPNTFKWLEEAGAMSSAATQGFSSHTMAHAAPDDDDDEEEQDAACSSACVSKTPKTYAELAYETNRTKDIFWLIKELNNDSYEMTDSVSNLKQYLDQSLVPVLMSKIMQSQHYDTTAKEKVWSAFVTIVRNTYYESEHASPNDTHAPSASYDATATSSTYHQPSSSDMHYSSSSYETSKTGGSSHFFNESDDC